MIETTKISTKLYEKLVEAYNAWVDVENDEEDRSYLTDDLNSHINSLFNLFSEEPVNDEDYD